MRTPAFVLALAALTVGATAASAQVNLRQANQERRIDAGTRSGKLTAGEAARLRGEQHSIEREKAVLKARHGGRLTRADKARIHARQNAANRGWPHSAPEAQCPPRQEPPEAVGQAGCRPPRSGVPAAA